MKHIINILFKLWLLHFNQIMFSKEMYLLINRGSEGELKIQWCNTLSLNYTIEEYLEYLQTCFVIW